MSSVLTNYTDANWGAQDASQLAANETFTIDECRSLLGTIITIMGGAVVWESEREPSSVSRSTCESEIRAARRHILSDPISIFLAPPLRQTYSTTTNAPLK